MSLHRKPQLSAKRRRYRKARLAERDGRRCFYCRRPFDSLRGEATLDHVVPFSLLRTWSESALVLACLSCNDRKADRLPLSLALLLVFTNSGERVHAESPDSVHEQSAAGVHERSAGRVGSESADAYAVDWRLLARLAHAHQSTYAAVWTPDPIPVRSTPGRCESSRHAVLRRPTARPDCLRAPRPVRTCVRPTGEAVPA